MIERIHERATFRRFGSSARRVRRGPLTLVIADGDDADVVGVAFAVPRRVGGAVVRNRLRRQLRAALREIDRTRGIPTGWYLVVVHPNAAGRSFEVLHRALDDAVSGAFALRSGGDA